MAVHFGLVGPERNLGSGVTPIAANGGSFAASLGGTGGEAYSIGVIWRVSGQT